MWIKRISSDNICQQLGGYLVYFKHNYVHCKNDGLMVLYLTLVICVHELKIWHMQ